jgi:hypothetical protein
MQPRFREKLQLSSNCIFLKTAAMGQKNLQLERVALFPIDENVRKS